VPFVHKHVCQVFHVANDLYVEFETSDVVKDSLTGDSNHIGTVLRCPGACDDECVLAIIR
jgi:hypothetical protein